MVEQIYTENIPVIALRGVTVFPDQTVHFDIGRMKSILALEHAMKRDQILFLVPQKNLMDEDPDISKLYSIGTVVKVKQLLKSQNESIRILVNGLYRAKLEAIHESVPFLKGDVRKLSSKNYTETMQTRALRRQVNELYGNYLEMVERPNQPVQFAMLASDDCGFIADCVGQFSGFDHSDKARLLCQLNPVKRLNMALGMLQEEVYLQQIEMEIQDRTRSAIDQDQRDYFLREQMKVIRQELGEKDGKNEFEEYCDRIQALKLDEEHEKKLLKDVSRLEKQPFGSSEASVLRNYLDLVLELPWNVRTKERLDIAAARKILDRDHFGMEKVKERILESLAVRKLAPDMPAQIICLVGPPGVGKTSIAYSIAESLNRKMARVALGGVHDEAEIRGHRKTYVGAMPGRIITGISQAGSQNALLLLDEVDKLGSDYRGDPSAALLEVLDAEQNKTYRDHFVEIPFDLSSVMFITTANTLDTIPRPLRDRMEIIELGSYTDEEKVMIAKRHLIPKQLKKHGVEKKQIRITDDAIRAIISGYTRESGVRNLERCIAEICRKVAVQILSQEDFKKAQVTPATLETYLGIRKFIPDHHLECDQVGVVTGLAWTSVGGETLEVEVSVMEGSGKLELTGNLGDVMKESAHAAFSYVRANAAKLCVPTDFYKTKDIHIHFPEGAVPKDGPSAGIAVCTALVSALSQRAVRRDVAMTGEISIRGRVMAIGGLKEKTMAALRHGIKTVIIPSENLRDLEEIDQTVRSSLEFVAASSMETVLETALVPRTERVSSYIPPIAIPAAREKKPEIRQ